LVHSLHLSFDGPSSMVYELLWNYFVPRCRNPNLGLTTKARACKVAGQEGSLGVTSHAPGSAKECEGMNPHTPKWTLILKIGIPNGLANL
jgi:hypothetical protein